MFFEMLSIAIPLVAIFFFSRNESDGLWQTLMEVHQSNLDDIKEQEKTFEN